MPTRNRYLLPAAVITLGIALVAGGTATAARLITGAQVKNSSLTGADVKNGSLRPVDFQGSITGPRGPAGPPGTSGAPGAPGVSGTVTSVIEVLGPDTPMGVSGSGTEVQSSKAECPPGTVVTGGGFHGGVRTFIGDAVKSGNGYFVIGINNGLITSSIQAQALCGSTGASVASGSESGRSTVAAERAALKRVRDELAATQK